MDSTQILILGLGLQAPWILKNQHLDTSVSPHRLDLHVEAERGSLYPCPECGKTCQAFSAFLTAHGGDTDNVAGVVCDMSPALLGGITGYFPRAEVTVDWFHLVQTFTKRLDEVRKKERRERVHPESLCWALLKNLDNENLTPEQLAALQELVADQSATADAWIIKEKLRWIQKTPTPRAARWRITNHLKVMQAAASDKPRLKPMKKALATLERHSEAVVRRWLSGLTNARLEGMNGLFQAARSRARGYRNEANFIAMTYLIGSPVGRLFNQAKST